MSYFPTFDLGAEGLRDALDAFARRINAGEFHVFPSVEARGARHDGDQEWGRWKEFDPARFDLDSQAELNRMSTHLAVALAYDRAEDPQEIARLMLDFVVALTGDEHPTPPRHFPRTVPVRLEPVVPEREVPVTPSIAEVLTMVLRHEGGTHELELRAFFHGGGAPAGGEEVPLREWARWLERAGVVVVDWWKPTPVLMLRRGWQRALLALPDSPPAT